MSLVVSGYCFDSVDSNALYNPHGLAIKGGRKTWKLCWKKVLIYTVLILSSDGFS